MASTLAVSDDSSCSLPENTKPCRMTEYQNEASLSPARPAESPDLPEEQGNTSTFLEEDTLHTEENGMVTLDGNILTAEMKKEEEELEKANEKEEERMRKEMEERSRQEKELQDQRYKRLMHLLNKSEFYSQFLLRQIESQKAVIRVNRKKKRAEEVASSQEKSSSQSDSGSSESVTRSGRKRKRQSEGRTNKRSRNEKYRITDVIDSDTVRAKAEQARDAGEEDMGKENIDREDQPRLLENGTMRPYQLDGFSWLLALFENGVNGILGDEMGLGKTIQTIALLCHLIDQGVPGPFLVVGPLSTLPNWMSEFERFAPKVPTLLYHGHESVRIERRHMIRTRVSVPGLTKPVFPVVMTSYEVAVRDTKYLNKYHWRYICVDEGHRLKNYKCRLTKSLNTYPSTNRLLLTGTPLQNNLAELWALLNFLMPDIFDSLDVFESWFDVTDMTEDGSEERIIQQEREKQVIATLMKILSPFFLRRVKADVDLEIPPKKELLVYTPMTPQQMELYEATLTMNFEHFDALKKSEANKIEYDERGRPMRWAKKNVDMAFLDESDSMKALDDFIDTIQRNHMESAKETEHVPKTNLVRVKLQNRMMQLRKIVNHPYLIDYPLNEDETTKLMRVCCELVGSCRCWISCWLSCIDASIVSFSSHR